MGVGKTIFKNTENVLLINLHAFSYPTFTSTNILTGQKYPNYIAKIYIFNILNIKHNSNILLVLSKKKITVHQI